MKPDLDYFSKLFNVFLDADAADITLKEIECSGVRVTNGLKMDEKFIFHTQLSLDNALLGSRQGPASTLADLGIIEWKSGGASIKATRIRLTQDGHDFAIALNNKEVLSKLKSELKDAPFKVVFEGGQKLLQHYMKKKT